MSNESKVTVYENQPLIRCKYGQYLNKQSRIPYSIDLGELGVWLFCPSFTSEYLLSVYMKVDQVKFIEVGDFKD